MVSKGALEGFPSMGLLDGKHAVGGCDGSKSPGKIQSRKPRVLVGMSGGVDSSVAAALLVEAGFDVCGAYMKNWILDVPGMRCPWADDLADAKRTAVRLGIDFRVYDFQEVYKREVVDYLVAEYRAGRTPNPDIMCNQEVKFGLFLDTALEDGFDLIATGHYARRAVLPNDVAVGDAGEPGAMLSPCADYGMLRGALGSAAELSYPSDLASSTVSVESRAMLLRGADEHKDQTYFLYRMSQRALDHTLFPLGEFTKPQVRAMAEERGLPSADKADSQGICFVGEAGIREFLSLYVEPRPGPTIDVDTGQVVGRHDGAIYFTIGQRKGLGIGGGTAPYYVVSKDMERNEVYVSASPDVATRKENTLKLARLSWICGEAPSSGTYLVRTRHTGPLVEAHVECTGDKALLTFSQPANPVAPGQSAVIYEGLRCLGGGIVA